MAAELPETVPELCDYIERYADSIYVRDQVAGKWGSYALTQLPCRLAIQHVLRFVREGAIPVRVLSKQERAERRRS